MKALDSLKIQYNCSKCTLDRGKFFCRVADPVLEAFEAVKITNSYPRGSALFAQGQPSQGVYMLCQGRVKLSTYSKDGKAIILRVADAGEILGLSAAVSDLVHQATAEAITACQVNFVGKHDFLRFLKQHQDASLNAITQLSQNYHAAYTQLRSFALSNSASEKLARLILEWSYAKVPMNGEIQLRMIFTHEEIAEMIGSSRETVTRILGDFRERKLITIHGSTLYIHDISGLESITGSRGEVVRQM